METCPGEGVVKEEKFPNSRKPSHRWVCGEFWNLRGQHNWEGEKKNTEYTCNRNAQQRSSPDMSATSEQGLNREVPAALLRVRTGTECPEDNLRELT